MNKAEDESDFIEGVMIDEKTYWFNGLVDNYVLGLSERMPTL